MVKAIVKVKTLHLNVVARVTGAFEELDENQ
jgi:hypothetical protein